jgi:MYXO-CTERM domain-containing protein
MKKVMNSIKLLMMFCVLSLSAPALAQNDNDRDRDEVREERLSDREERELARERDRDDLRDDDENEARNDDDDSNYGWIGLLGLAGLAGLLRRGDKRVAHAGTTYRSTDTGTGRTDLGSSTNRSV